MAKIIGPGSLNVDLTGYTPHLPVAGETVLGSKVSFGPGGKGLNQMTAAHRAGADTYIIGRRGEDVLGVIIKRHFENEGMSDRFIQIGPEDVTGTALIEIDEGSAQNRIIVISGSNDKVTDKEVSFAEDDFASADAVLAQFETNLSSIEKAKELANKYNKPFILNPAPYRDVPQGFFNGVDFITPNETEAEQYTGVKVETIEDCRKAAKCFFDMGVKNVIITLGSRGAFFASNDEEILVPSIKVKAVETTGAGDAFNGGFATAIAEGKDVRYALAFGTCTAALSVTRNGAAASMPYREEILKLLKENF